MVPKPAGTDASAPHHPGGRCASGAKGGSSLLSALRRLLEAGGVCPLLRRHLLCCLLCLGRHTLTGLLRTDGRISQDWTADYRLYARARVDPQNLFAVVREEIGRRAPRQRPLVLAMDDTLLRKRGRKIPGVAWRRDPLSPPFQVNLVLGQRVLQTSLMLPLGRQGQALAVPIDLTQAPTAVKPHPQAGAAAQQAYREEQKQRNLNAVALGRLEYLERWFGAQGESRPRWLVVDNRLTNRTVLRSKPGAVTLIGRIRKDAKLYGLPEAGAPACRIYGAPQPTPEQIRQDAARPWQTVRAYAAGKVHDFRVKVLRTLRWRGMGRQNLMLVVLAPLGYRLQKKGKVLYREPAYLICTDAQADLQQVLQAYLWRWGIEVNFRDEKTLLGVGQAQVRNPESVARLPAMAVGAYALLLLAGVEAFGSQGAAPDVPVPAWYKNRRPQRAGTMQLLQQLRRECWQEAIAPAARSDFTAQDPGAQKSLPPPIPPLDSAVFNAVAG